MPPKKKDVAPQKVLLGRPGNRVKMGIVGLPNVGKSSFFNALAKLNVAAENFPFCTIDPNVAMVPVPDQRLQWLIDLYKPKSEVFPVLTVTDIAGLVKGASEGAGLGNAFLSHIQGIDGIYHMVRAFKSDDVTHVEGDVNPVRDMEIIHNELLIKDMATIQNAINDRRKNVERGLGGKEKKMEFESLEKILAYMKETGKDISFGDWSALDVIVLNTFQLLTAKRVIYLVNLSKKDYLRKANKFLPDIMKFVEGRGGGELVIPLSVAFETELVDLELAGGTALADYQAANPTHKSVLNQILKKGYHSLNLIHFFTAGKDEVKAWTIRKGKLAPQAAGVIHTDFEKGFIKADTMSFADIKAFGSEAAVKEGGRYRSEGKNYVVQDGDIFCFKHN